MRVLFYIEPVVFRKDPAWLTGHINNVRCFINANQSHDVEYGLATSPQHLVEYDRWLQYGGVKDLRRFPISSRDMIEAFDFDRFAYAADLYKSGSSLNGNLCRALKTINDDFEPDIVISISENSYLPIAFSKAKIAFHEIGPIPRRDGRNNYYFDFGGHGSGSIMADRLGEILTLPVSDEVAQALSASFREWFMRHPGFEEAAARFREWREASAMGKRIAVIAIQPSDNISLEGVLPAIPLDTFIMRILAQLPAGWAAVLTYHSQMEISGTMEMYLANEFPNLLLMPETLRSLGSDPFAGEIDAIITVNSKSALTAALLGKRVRALGQSLINGMGNEDIAALDFATTFDDAAAGRILAFISNRYSFSFEECFEKNGVILNFFRNVLASSDPLRFQLSLDQWKPEHVLRILN